MNPALVLLAVLSLAPLWVRTRRWAVAPSTALTWALVGLVGLALLAPALSLPDGVPGPGANLGRHAPWQGLLDPADGNPNLRDIPHQIQPWLLFLRRELGAGRLPFWNPHQFAGTPFWANGQSAPLFPLHLLFAALPPLVGFVLLPWLRFVAAGMGARALARELGLSETGALVAALVFPLSGMLVSMLLFPMANALALVPWVLWATERLAAGKASWVPLAALAGLQMLGGHPETSIHTGMLAALYLLLRGSAGGGRLPTPAVTGRFVLAWLLGAAVAAVHLLPLALLLPETTKVVEFAGVERPPLGVVGREMLRLVLPEAYGHPAEGTWWGPFSYAATAAYAGALALPLAAAGLVRARRDRRWAAVGGLTAVALLIAYHLPGLIDLLLGLPGLERVAHHRLLFGVELGLALFAGAGWEAWLAGRGRLVWLGTAVTGLLLGVAWLVFAEAWEGRGLLGSQAAWSVRVAVLAALPTVALALPRARRGWLAPLLPALLVVDLLAAHGGILRAAPLARLYPETPVVETLDGRQGRVAGLGTALHPNAAMVYGLDDLRGDDPVKLARFEAVYRRLAPADPVYFRPIRRWDREVLDRLAVRWVVGPPGVEAPRPGWRRVHDGPDARLWERPTAQPMVRWEGAGTSRLEVRERAPGTWAVEVEAMAAGRLVVAETYAAGWQARLDGVPATVGRAPVVPPDVGGLLAVEVPEGRHRVVLAYTPPGFVAGALTSALGLAALLLAGLSGRRGGGLR